MATAAEALETRERSGSGELSLLRLYVLRAAYLLLVVGLGATIVPQLVEPRLTDRGVITCLLSGLWLMAFVGLRYPVQMLPLLLFELMWKLVWLARFGFPQKLSGDQPPTFADDWTAILPGAAIMLLVIPWRHVWQRYIVGPGDKPEPGAGPYRLKVMRAVYLLMFIPGSYIIFNAIVQPVNPRGVFASMLTAMFVLSPLVVRHPLKMIPMLLLEVVWKLIWLAAFGIPKWSAGMMSPLLREDLVMIGLGPLFFGLLIPWTYVWAMYVRRPAERWR